MLDFGGGGGQFALVARSHLLHAEVHIVDKSDVALLRPWRNMNRQIPFAEFETDPTRFDYIFMNDVFEHLSDPIGVLRMLRSKLVPDGRIFFHGATSPLPPYRKYGPTIPGVPGTAAWCSLPGATFGTAVVGGATVQTVTLSLVDGALGDATAVDGMIVDPGGVAASAPGIPALGSWGVATLSALLLGAGALALRRRPSQHGGP